MAGTTYDTFTRLYRVLFVVSALISCALTIMGHKPEFLDKSPGYYEKEVGDTVRLRCDVMNWQRGWEMDWYKNGTLISDASKSRTSRTRSSKPTLLRIRYLISEDSGIYTCVASNQYGSVSKELNLTVIGRKPKFLDKSQVSYIKDVGETVRLKCDVMYWHREWKLDWYKNGILISDASKNKRFRIRSRKPTLLRIKYLTNEDSGVYKCVARNQYGSVAKELKLTVIDLKPKFLDKSPGHYTEEVGEIARLRCDVMNWQSWWKVDWYKNGTFIDDRKIKRFRIRSKKPTLLRIKYLRHEDSGIYKCVASNQYGRVAKELNLTVTGNPPRKPGVGPPWFTKHRSIVPNLFIEWSAFVDMNLRCAADGERPLKYHWLKDGEVLKYRRLDARFNATRWILQIKTAVPSDNGLYTCIVSNRLGNISRSYKLHVVEKAVARPILSTHVPVNHTDREGLGLYPQPTPNNVFGEKN